MHAKTLAFQLELSNKILEMNTRGTWPSAVWASSHPTR